MDSDGLETRVVVLRRFAAAFFLILMAATWPLWTPEHGFPQVPFARWLGRLPDSVQWLSLAAVVAAWLAALGAANSTRLAWPSALAAIVFTLVALGFDQHRAQAWAYQITLSLMALASCRRLRHCAGFAGSRSASISIRRGRNAIALSSPRWDRCSSRRSRKRSDFRPTPIGSRVRRGHWPFCSRWVKCSSHSCWLGPRPDERASCWRFFPMVCCSGFLVPGGSIIALECSFGTCISWCKLR